MSGYNQTLKEVQAKLKAPKGQFNSFGKYRYRSCEDIVEAVKPLLSEHGGTLTLSDELELIGDRYYIKATATFASKEGEVTVSAYAREPLTKKGMDDSQVTGTASSYARKYALNGLFAIDDTKDADTDEYARRTEAEQPDLPQISAENWEKLIDLCKETGVTYKELSKKVGPFKQHTMTSDQYSKCMMILAKAKE